MVYNNVVHLHLDSHTAMMYGIWINGGQVMLLVWPWITSASGDGFAKDVAEQDFILHLTTGMKRRRRRRRNRSRERETEEEGQVVVEKTVIIYVPTDYSPSVHHDLQGNVQVVHGTGWEGK
jgi:hypothetical protein